MSRILVGSTRTAGKFQGGVRRSRAVPIMPTGALHTHRTLLRATLRAIVEISLQMKPTLVQIKRAFSEAMECDEALRIVDEFVLMLNQQRVHVRRVWSRYYGRHSNVVAFDHHIVHRNLMVYLLVAAMLLRHVDKKVAQQNASLSSVLTDLIRHMNTDIEQGRLLGYNFKFYLDPLSLRTTAGHTEPIQWNLLDTLLQAMKRYRFSAPTRVVHFDCDERGLAALPEVSAVAACLVADNLLCNAAMYSSARPSEIVIRGASSADGAMCGFMVENRGLGIRTSELGVVFAAGYRGARAARVAPGAGLGLFVVKRLIELSGGQIQVQSTPLNGLDFLTRVTVMFPVLTSQKPYKSGQ